MVVLFLLSALAASPPADLPAVEAQLLSGETIAGRLVELGAQGIAIRTAKGRVATELGQLAGLTVKSPQPVSELRAAVWIELVDGSVLAGTSYTSAEGRSKIALLGSAAMEISTQEVKTVRFQAQSDVVSAQWTKIVDTEAPADFLVLRKEDALDYHRGAIRGVTADTVRFELDGEVLSVKSAKVYGIVYHHPQGRQLPDAICSITDISGSSFAVRTVAASGDSLQWTTPAGVTISRPAASVARIDFSIGNLLYLSDLKPDSVEWTPYFSLGRELAVRSEFFAPKQDRSLSGGSLELDGKKYAKGVAIHSRTTITYRLRGRFSRFKAIAGIDDKAKGAHGDVQLIVRGDEKVLFDAAIAWSDAAKTMDLDVSGIRRLTVVVDYGNNGDIGDHLDLCDARLVK